MRKLVVSSPTGGIIASVIPSSKGKFKVNTDDEGLRQIITGALAAAEERGLILPAQRSAPTKKGMRYESLGRWVMPSEEEFLDALFDHLAKQNLLVSKVDD